MSSRFLRLHAFCNASKANGPGLRAVIWTQGCTLGCPGCFNSQTHSALNGQMISIDAIFTWLLPLEGVIEGLTISGGEPLQQLGPLLSLLEEVHTKTSLSTLVFTGYTWEEVGAMPQSQRLLAVIDVLLCGRYQADQHLGCGLRGSTNKTVHFLSDRYSLQDLQAVPPAEVLISSGGKIQISGIDPPLGFNS